MLIRRFYSKLRDSLADHDRYDFAYKLFCFSFAVMILIASVGMRLPVVTGIGRLGRLTEYWNFFVLALSVGILLRQAPRLIGMYLMCIGILYLHAYTLFFWPSLRLGVPWQDYLLVDEVSSNHCLFSGMVYLKNISRFLLPWLAFFLGQGPKSGDEQNYPFWGLIVGLAINACVAIVQGLHGVEFLAQGSGSAVAAGRAAGLLEDSGASTVYFSALVSGLFGLLVFHPMALRVRWVLALFTLVVLCSGMYTGGRVYFLATAFGLGLVSVCLGFSFFRKRQFKRLILGFVVLVGVVGAALSVYLKFNLRAQTLTQLKLGDRSFIESLYAIDLVRAVNNRTLYKAFLEHPIKGNGLGSSYASYYEHLNWARIQNADILGDPPASLFFMLAGELGIVGILLFGLLSWMSLRFLFMSASGQKILLSSKQHLAYSPLALGVWSALMLSFWTGVHFIFSSVSCLIALCLAVLIQSTAGMRFLEKRVLFCATALCFAWLAVIGLSQCFAAPRVPAFRWKERGKPQVPLSVNVPLKGHAPGVWLRSGAEVYLSDGLLKLYLELPVRYYPIKLTIEAIDPSGRNFAERVIEVEANDPQKLGQYFDVQFEGYQKAGCTHPAKPSSFCSARLTVENPWIFEGSEIGVLWVDARPI